MLEGDLSLVREFVNTYGVESDREALATPGDLAGWLRHQGLLGRADAASEADLARAHELREAVRELLMVNHDGEATGTAHQAAEVLTGAARVVGLRSRFTASGTHRLVPTASGVDRGLGEILVLIARAMADGTWRRLKVCREDTCRWAFFDASRSGAGKWCSMAVCGNRRKARAWRARQRTSP